MIATSRLHAPTALNNYPRRGLVSFIFAALDFDAIVFAVFVFEAIVAAGLGIGLRWRLPGASTTPPLRPPLAPLSVVLPAGCFGGTGFPGAADFPGASPPPAAG